MFKGVPIFDIITLAVGLGGLLFGLMSRNTTVKKWLDKIGGQATVERAISVGMEFSIDSPEERRKKAVVYLQKVARENYGVTLPTSIANLLVEWVYQAYKKRTGK